jgi:hypothetical protein
MRIVVEKSRRAEERSFGSIGRMKKKMMMSRIAEVAVAGQVVAFLGRIGLMQ